MDEALDAYLERPELTPTEERVVATHEAGHAICAMYCPHAPAIDRISIRGDLAGALGFVQYGDDAHRYVTTQNQMLDSICTLFGGREAELLVLDDLSAGSAQDLERATDIAKNLVERLGMGEGSDVAVFKKHRGRPELSEEARAALDRSTVRILDAQRERARRLLEEHRVELEALRDLLLEHKVVERSMLANMGTKKAKKGASRG